MKYFRDIPSRVKAIAILLLALTIGLGLTRAAVSTPQWEHEVRRLDHDYWAAYNRRDSVAMNSFLSDDVEFYHDRGGTLIGKSALAAANEGMRTNPDHLRREEVPGTVRFFPMRHGDDIYGAVVTGEHRFYITEVGKKERPVGRALFTHLLLRQDGKWHITRILSYEHADTD
jgi:ketosteroid isomerase-like protein